MELIDGHRPIQPAEGIHVWDVDPYSDANLTNPKCLVAFEDDKTLPISLL